MQKDPDTDAAPETGSSLSDSVLVQRLEAFWKLRRGATFSYDEPTTGVANIESSLGDIGKYRLLRVLGSGGFGVVYLGHDPELSRQVAIKIPHLEVLSDKAKLDRFCQEAGIAASLDHPGIVPVYEAELESPVPFIVTAYCTGPNLAQWIDQQEQPPDWKTVCDFVIKIGEALGHSHRQGVVHRDLKPANILLFPKETLHSDKSENLIHYEPKITDFGLGKCVDAALTNTRSSLIIGSPLYMAPELAGTRSKLNQDELADIFSVGVILFEMLSLTHPFVGETAFEVMDQIRNHEPKMLNRLNRHIPRQLHELCHRCLEKKPNHRVASAELLTTDLRNCVTGNPISKSDVSVWDRLMDFCFHENRIRDGGWFTVWSQLVIAVWTVGLFGLMAMNVLAQPNTDLSLSNTLPYILLIGMLSTTQAVFGWLTVRRIKWGAWTAFLSTLVTLFLVVEGCLGRPPMFPEIYAEHQWAAVVAHFLLFSLHLIQAGLLTCALLALHKRSAIG